MDESSKEKLVERLLGEVSEPVRARVKLFEQMYGRAYAIDSIYDLFLRACLNGFQEHPVERFKQ